MESFLKHSKIFTIASSLHVLRGVRGVLGAKAAAESIVFLTLSGACLASFAGSSVRIDRRLHEDLDLIY